MMMKKIQLFPLEIQQERALPAVSIESHSTYSLYTEPTETIMLQDSEQTLRGFSENFSHDNADSFISYYQGEKRGGVTKISLYSKNKQFSSEKRPRFSFNKRKY